MALFKTTAEIRTFAPKLETTFQFADLLPFIHQAEDEYIRNIIGDAQYTALEAAYQASSMTTAQSSLLAKIQPALANLAIWIGIPVFNVNITGAGIAVLSSDKLAPASQYRTEELKDTLKNIAFQKLDKLVEFMETNKTDYPLWTASAEFDELYSLVINTAKDFSKYFNIRNSRWIFWNIRNIILRVEEDKIRPLLGFTLYDVIKSEIADGSIDPLNEELLKIIKPCVAHFTMCKAIDELAIEISDKGVTIFNNEKTQSVSTKIPATESRIDRIKRSCEVEGDKYLKQLEDYLYDNISDYPDFTSSDAYAPDDTSTFENDDEENFLFVG